MTTPSTPTGGGATPTTAGTAGTAGGTTTSTGDPAAGETAAPAPEPSPEVEEVKTTIAEADAPKGKTVQYVGTSRKRVISKADWATLGIDLDTVTFSKANGFKVDASDWPEDALKYAEHVDTGLKVIE